MYISDELKQLTFDVYIRRSSDDADHQVASLESQREVLSKLVKQNRIKVGRVVEESMSAKQPGRPIFNEEMDRADKGLIQGLVLWDISRGARNPVDGGKLSWLLQTERLKAIITPHKVYLPEDNVLLLNVEFGMANQYVRDLSKNVKRGLQTKLTNGWRPGCTPEGYLNDKSEEKGNRKIITDEVRFPLVRKMWDLLLTGSYTVPQILKIANEEWKYTTVKHKKTGGTPLSRAGLYRIFNNPFFYGWYQYGADKKWYWGEHKKMITQDEYDQAQAILGKKGKQRPKTREFAFTGMIRCEECGAMITAEEKINRYGTRYIYYHCTKRVNPDCIQKSVELQELERQVDDILEKTEIPEVFRDWAIQYLNELHEKETQEQASIAESVDSAYKDCLARINNLVKLKISPMNTDGSVLSDEDFEVQMKPLKQNKKDLEEQRQSLGIRADRWLELSQKTFNFACQARYKFQTGSLIEKKEILQAIGSNFTLFNKTLHLISPEQFLVIERAKATIEEMLAMFEPEEKVDNKLYLMDLFDQNLTLRRW